MSCGRFEQRLHYLLDQRCSPGEDMVLRRHAEVCERCSRLLVAQERLFAGLESSRPKTLEWDVADYVVRTAQRLALQRQHRKRRAWGLAACAAAVGLAAVLAVVMWPAVPRTPRAIPEQLVAVPPSPVIERPARSATPWPALSVPFAYTGRFTDGESSTELTQRMRQLYRDSTDRGLEPVNRLTGDLRPLASTVNAAFDTIVDVVRSDEPDLAPSH